MHKRWLHCQDRKWLDECARAIDWQADLLKTTAGNGTTRPEGQGDTMKIEYGTFTDPRDKQEYRAFRLNGLLWLADPLNFKTEGSSRETTYGYENKIAGVKKYLCEYKWEDAKEASPPGWRLPSDKEWKELQAAVKQNEALREYMGRSGGGPWLSSDELNQDEVSMWGSSYNFIESVSFSMKKSKLNKVKCVSYGTDGFVAREPELNQPEVELHNTDNEGVIFSVRLSNGELKGYRLNFANIYCKIKDMLRQYPDLLEEYPELNEEEPKPKKRKKAA
jgi:uncharacterized protein (TIGR02145 family)